MSKIINKFINNKNENVNGSLNQRDSELHNLLVSRYEASFRNKTLEEQNNCLQALLNDIKNAEKEDKKIKKLTLRK